MHHSASLILMRNRPEPELYWVRRASDTTFLSGYYAFPGGFVDASDWSEPEDIRGAARNAALRETHEEVGIDLGDRPPTYLGRWIAPPYLVKKLTTHYFLAWADGLDPAVDDGNPELDAGEWIRPRDALERWRTGQALMAPPTRVLIEALAEHDGVPPDSVFESAEAHGEEPTLSAVRRNLMMIPLLTPTLPPATHTNCYVLGDDVLLIVEPASPHPSVMSGLFSYLDQRIGEGATLKAILLTHHHHDHIGGVMATVERYGLPVWAHEKTAQRVPFPIDRLLEDGEDIEADPGSRWRVVYTPGHAPGHICFLSEDSGDMVVGDMVAGVGSILVEPTDGDMALYLDSLARMRTFGPTSLLPSHGPAIGGADAKLAQYIDHRLQREATLIEGLNAGMNTLKALVDHVYTDVPAGLRAGPDGGLAGLSLRSHLDKLERDGLVTHDAQSWTWCGPDSAP